MKFPWSKKKYAYTKHSAPVTNGILRNGKGAAANNRPRSCGDLQVTFSPSPLPRASGSHMILDAVRVASGATGSERRRAGDAFVRGRPHSEEEYPRKLKPLEKVKTHGSDPHRERKSKNGGDRKSSSRNALQHSDDSSNSMSTCENPMHRMEGGGGQKRSARTESELSDDSSAKPNTLEIPRRRLGDMPPDNISSGYGKWESTSTIDTADISEHSESSRTRTLSELLDEKIEAKLRRQAEQAKSRVRRGAVIK